MSTVTPHLKMEFPSVNELLSTLPELVSLWDDLGAGSIRSPSHDYGGKPYDYHSHHFHGDNTSASNCHFTNHVRSSTVSVEYAHDFPRLIDWSYSNLESTVKWQGSLLPWAASVSPGPVHSPTISQFAIAERTTHRSALLERRRARQKALRTAMSRDESTDWEGLSQFSMPEKALSGG